MCAGRRQPGLIPDLINVTRCIEPESWFRNQPVCRQFSRLIRGARAGQINMPIFRYFLYVGGSLLALLLVANAALPTEPFPSNLTSASDLPPIRIHSDRKLPERVVLDTSAAMPA